MIVTCSSLTPVALSSERTGRIILSLGACLVASSTTMETFESALAISRSRLEPIGEPSAFSTSAAALVAAGDSFGFTEPKKLRTGILTQTSVFPYGNHTSTIISSRAVVWDNSSEQAAFKHCQNKA